MAHPSAPGPRSDAPGTRAAESAPPPGGTGPLPAGSGESPLRGGPIAERARVVLVAIVLGALSAGLAAAVVGSATPERQDWLLWGFAGMLLGLGLGAGASHASGEWINLGVLVAVMTTLGALSGVVERWFPQDGTLYRWEIAVLIALGACAVRRLENLRELDTYVLRPRNRTQVAVGWTLLEGLGCGGECGLGALISPGGCFVGGAFLLVALLAGGGVYFVYLFGRRLLGATADLGMERMVEEFFLIGAIGAVIPMFFGRFFFAGVVIVGLLILFLAYVWRILSPAGLLLYGIAGLAVGLFPWWIHSRLGAAAWVGYGAAAGFAMAGEVWVGELLSAWGRALERAGWRGAAFRVYSALARGHAGRAEARSFALRAATLALEMGRLSAAAELFARAGEHAAAGRVWLAAARRSPGPHGGAPRGHGDSDATQPRCAP